MSCIAWDGYSIAADKQADREGLKYQHTKLFGFGLEALAYTGRADYGAALIEWYKNGADPAKWPEFQKDKDDWTRLIVAKAEGVVSYDQVPYPLPYDVKFHAWGEGRDFAIAAMDLGLTAKQAVEVACRHCSSCGLGVDEIVLREGPERNFATRSDSS